MLRSTYGRLVQWIPGHKKISQEGILPIWKPLIWSRETKECQEKQIRCCVSQKFKIRSLNLNRGNGSQLSSLRLPFKWRHHLISGSSKKFLITRFIFPIFDFGKNQISRTCSGIVIIKKIKNKTNFIGLNIGHLWPPDGIMDHLKNRIGSLSFSHVCWSWCWQFGCAINSRFWTFAASLSVNKSRIGESSIWPSMSKTYPSKIIT